MQLLQALNAENEDARASSSEGREEPKVGKMICCCYCHVRIYYTLGFVDVFAIHLYTIGIK